MDPALCHNWCSGIHQCSSSLLSLRVLDPGAEARVQSQTPWWCTWCQGVRVEFLGHRSYCVDPAQMVSVEVKMWEIHCGFGYQEESTFSSRCFSSIVIHHLLVGTAGGHLFPKLEFAKLFSVKICLIVPMGTNAKYQPSIQPSWIHQGADFITQFEAD